MTSTNSSGGEQIPLQFHKFEPLTFEQFIAGDNSGVISSIHSIIHKTETKPLYIWGKQGTGKSHLLQAACEAAAQLQQSVAYIPLEIVIQNPPESLDGLEQQDLICIDDIDLLSKYKEWQTAIFHFYNRLQEHNKQLIMSSKTSPLNIDIQLADLKSRLSWGLTLYLEEMSDQNKIELLQQKAKLRAFELSKEVAGFLLKNTDRNIDHLLSILDKIDKHSLAQQRKITIPFVKSILK